MSPRDSFWFLAGALVTFAIMVTVRAWLRERPVQAVRNAIPSFAVPIAAALALIGVALGIYFLLGSPDSIASAHSGASERVSDTRMTSANPSQQQSGQASAGSLDDVTRKLAARLAAKGGSDSEWKLLAESYDYMGLTAEAKAARAHIASAAASDAGSSATDEPTVTQMAAVADALDSPAVRNSTTPATAATAQISGTVEIAPKLVSH